MPGRTGLGPSGGDPRHQDSDGVGDSEDGDDGCLAKAHVFGGIGDPGHGRQVDADIPADA